MNIDVNNIETACNYFEEKCKENDIEVIVRKDINYGYQYKVRYHG